MQEQNPRYQGHYLLVIMFFGVIIISLILVVTGVAFVELAPEKMAFVLMILVPIGAMMAGVIFIYSLARYTVENRFRNLVLIFMALNLGITIMLYFLTNVSMGSISPFADRARNRTIVAAFGLVLAPSALFAGASEEIDYSKKRIIGAIIWGGLICPLVSFWFFLSPEPVFLTSIPGEGMQPVAYLIIFLLVPVLLHAIWRYYQTWKMEHNKLDFAASLSLIIWIYNIGLYSTQTNPYQFLELIWFSVFISGELLLAMTMISTEIIEPQKNLSSLVEIRTEELSESKKESEFYLNIWGHKIGNLLQSMMLYIEMFSSGKKSARELAGLAEIALDIGYDANQINKQVAALIRLKEKESHELVPVNLFDTIKSHCRVSEETYGSNRIINFSENLTDMIHVQGDELLENVFENLFSFIYRHDSNSKILLHPKVSDETISIQVDFDEPRLSKDTEDSLFSTLQLSQTATSLDLFLVKILMERYGGNLRYEWVEASRKNQFLLTFNRDLSKVTEQDLVEKQMVSSKKAEHS